MHLGTYNNSPHRKFFWAFLLLVLVMAGVVINYTLARTTIIIHPKIESKSTEVNLTVDAKALKPNLENLVLPGRIVESQGEITKDVNTVTERKIEDFGKGAVKIKNIWKKDFFLQAGAQLVQGESPEVVGFGPKNIFLLDHEVSVPANGEVEATVTAKNKGLVGNIPPGRFYFLRMSSGIAIAFGRKMKANFPAEKLKLMSPPRMISIAPFNKRLRASVSRKLKK